MTRQLMEWREPAPPFELSLERVDLWRVALDPSIAESDDVAVGHLLNEEEKARAARFLRPELQRRWATARGSLRQILAYYLPISGREIEFVTNRFGKPEIASHQNRQELRFNLSHSHDRALVGITQRRPIGVDLERIRDDLEIEELATRFFAADEAERLQTFPEGELRVRAFFECWTRKESYIKARGEGLSHSLQSFVVNFGPNAQPALVSDAEDPSAPGRWTLKSFDPWPGFAGATIFEGTDLRIRAFSLDSVPAPSGGIV